MSDNNTASGSDNTLTSSATPEQAMVIGTLIMSLNSISLFAATIGVFTFLYIRLKYPKLADRVTFRIAFAALVSEVLFSIFQIGQSVQLNPTPVCSFVLWGWVFFSLTSVFFPTCIAIVSITYILVIIIIISQ